jgi:glycosyltransferase involved in cell wall biosynthesis
LNRAALIREAIESVLAQGYSHVEHILMDGGSTDGTLDVLRGYPHLRLVSQADRGMYDAINRGLKLARGEVIGLLNADDLYAPGSLQVVADVFDAHPEALAVVGGASTFQQGPRGREIVRTETAIEPDELWLRLIRGAPVTNAWFYRPAAIAAVGNFDDRFRYSSDRYFLIRLALDGGVRPVPIRRVLYHYRQHAGSATISTSDSRSPEYGSLRMKVLQEDVEIYEEILRRPDLPGHIRHLALAEHGLRCYRLSATALYHRQVGLALRVARRAWRRNAFWPLIFIGYAFERLGKAWSGRE